MAAIILHLGAELRRRWQEESQGFSFTELEFAQLLEECRKRTGAGWTKEYRDMSMNKLQRELLAALENWKMARSDESGLLWLTPLLGRTVGAYPDDYEPEKQARKREGAR